MIEYNQRLFKEFFESFKNKEEINSNNSNSQQTKTIIMNEIDKLPLQGDLSTLKKDELEEVYTMIIMKIDQICNLLIESLVIFPPQIGHVSPKKP
jgi:hypothetical protein